MEFNILYNDLGHIEFTIWGNFMPSESIILTIDQKTLDLYTKYYF